MKIHQLIKWLKNIRFQLFYSLITRKGIPLVTLGGECQWTILDQTLQSSSLVLCAGAGHDISFEKTLIQRYGCTVVLLDPSPTGIATVQKEAVPENLLKFHPIGLAGTDCLVNFDEPADTSEGSFRGNKTQNPSVIQFPCKSISTLLSELQWPRIDLLKIDIEGFEYDVLKDILINKLDVRQICVEFHYGKHFNHSRFEMIQCILALRKAGFDLVHQTHFDHTFVRR